MQLDEILRNDLLLIRGDARRLPLADESVQCIVTSPPYWGLRKYAGAQDLIWGVADLVHGRCVYSEKHKWAEKSQLVSIEKARWQNANSGADLTRGNARAVEDKDRGQNPTSAYQQGTCRRCGAWRGAFGLEPTIEMYVAHTLEILRECRRVLRPDGVLFWNIGDSYAAFRDSKAVPDSLRPGQGTAVPGGQAANRNPQTLRNSGIKHKDLCLIPARVALAAQADGWWVRSVIIWTKPNPMPESCRDRPTDAYEHILMLTKSAHYFWDAFAVREPNVKVGTYAHLAGGKGERAGTREGLRGKVAGRIRDFEQEGRQVGHHGQIGSELGRNLRNVWNFATQPYKGAHFATFPEELPRRCILAATSERGACRQCGAPWERITRRSEGENQEWAQDRNPSDKEKALVASGDRCGHGKLNRGSKEDYYENAAKELTVGWRPTCSCRGQRGQTVPCVVLDPFACSGTTGRVAIALNRRVVLVDLAYHDLSDKRTRNLQRAFPHL
jgi:DNA modification methylase